MLLNINSFDKNVCELQSCDTTSLRQMLPGESEAVCASPSRKFSESHLFSVGHDYCGVLLPTPREKKAAALLDRRRCAKMSQHNNVYGCLNVKRHVY